MWYQPIEVVVCWGKALPYPMPPVDCLSRGGKREEGGKRGERGERGRG